LDDYCILLFNTVVLIIILGWIHEKPHRAHLLFQECLVQLYTQLLAELSDEVHGKGMAFVVYANNEKRGKGNVDLVEAGDHLLYDPIVNLLIPK
jgi:hypothetical protein